jgi:hypothetical protein
MSCSTDCERHRLGACDTILLPAMRSTLCGPLTVSSLTNGAGEDWKPPVPCGIQFVRPVLPAPYHNYFMPADYDTPDVSVWFFALSPCHACQLEEAQKGETLFAGLMLYGHGVGPDQQKLSEPLKIPASATKAPSLGPPH